MRRVGVLSAFAEDDPEMRVVSGRSSDAMPAAPLIPMRQGSCKVRAYNRIMDGGPRLSLASYSNHSSTWTSQRTCADGN
jgi:hypothetical protein